MTYCRCGCARAVRPLESLTLVGCSPKVVSACREVAALSSLRELRLQLPVRMEGEAGEQLFWDLDSLVRQCARGLRRLELENSELAGWWLRGCRDDSEEWALPQLQRFASSGPFPRLIAPKLTSLDIPFDCARYAGLWCDDGTGEQRVRRRDDSDSDGDGDFEEQKWRPGPGSSKQAAGGRAEKQSDASPFPALTELHLRGDSPRGGWNP